jgi:hypothetical protein
MRPGGDPEPAVNTVLPHSFDPEAMAETLQRSTLKHTQLSRGRFRGRVFQAQSDAWRIDCGEYSLPVLARGPLAPDRISLGVLLQSPTESSLIKGYDFYLSCFAIYKESLGDSLTIGAPRLGRWNIRTESGAGRARPN